MTATTEGKFRAPKMEVYDAREGGVQYIGRDQSMETMVVRRLVSNKSLFNLVISG